MARIAEVPEVITLGHRGVGAQRGAVGAARLDVYLTDRGR